MKSKMTRTVTVISFFVTTFLNTTALLPAAHGQSCSLARAAGTYGFSTSGTVVGVGLRTSVGIVTLDAAGNATNGKATSSLNGTVTKETFSGMFMVNPDCTGTGSFEIFNLSGDLLLTVTEDLVWDDNMRELRLIFTSAVPPDGKPLPIVINGDARKMVP